jgi:hypothetical protein
MPFPSPPYLDDLFNSSKTFRNHPQSDLAEQRAAGSPNGTYRTLIPPRRMCDKQGDVGSPDETKGARDAK